jgi:hypothetical protein
MTIKNVHFLTFAAGKPCWHRSAERLSAQSRSYEEIYQRTLVNPTNLGNLIGNLALEVLELSSHFGKGFGLWSWKLPLLMAALKEMPAGNLLMYLDAGSTLNSAITAKRRFRDYLEMANESEGLFFQQNLIESAWTKRELREEFSNASNWGTGQLLGGIHFLKSCPDTIEFLEHVNQIAAKDNFAALKDPGPKSSQLSEFIAHRHDQSVLSLAAKQRSFRIIRDETYFAPEWSSSGKDYPIWASRLCSGNPSLTNNVSGRLRRELERRQPF